MFLIKSKVVTGYGLIGRAVVLGMTGYVFKSHYPEKLIMIYENICLTMLIRVHQLKIRKIYTSYTQARKWKEIQGSRFRYWHQNLAKKGPKYVKSKLFRNYCLLKKIFKFILQNWYRVHELNSFIIINFLKKLYKKSWVAKIRKRCKDEYWVDDARLMFKGWYQPVIIKFLIFRVLIQIWWKIKRYLKNIPNQILFQKNKLITYILNLPCNFTLKIVSLKKLLIFVYKRW